MDIRYELQRIAIVMYNTGINVNISCEEHPLRADVMKLRVMFAGFKSEAGIGADTTPKELNVIVQSTISEIIKFRLNETVEVEVVEPKHLERCQT